MVTSCHRSLSSIRQLQCKAGTTADLPSFSTPMALTSLPTTTAGFEGVLKFASTCFKGHDILVAAHSVGGFLVGMAPSNQVIKRVFTMGSQFAYWRDYAKHKRFAMYLRWHIVMPTLTAIFGYFPGKRLGWLEDTPSGVVRDWISPEPRFEDIYKSGPQTLSDEERAKLVESFAQVTAPTLAVSMSDDEFGTIPAIHRLLSYFKSSPSTHMRIKPDAVGQPSIGHFAFFNARYADSLWKIPLAWLSYPGNSGSACYAGAESVALASVRIQSINACA